jgi:hypothetical protein
MEEKTCPICYDSIDFVNIGCSNKHMICKTCVGLLKDSRCPMCRLQLKVFVKVIVDQKEILLDDGYDKFTNFEKIWSDMCKKSNDFKRIHTMHLSERGYAVFHINTIEHAFSRYNIKFVPGSIITLLVTLRKAKYISDLPVLPENLRQLNCSRNYISDISILPETLKHLTLGPRRY